MTLHEYKRKAHKIFMNRHKEKSTLLKIFITRHEYKKKAQKILRNRHKEKSSRLKIFLSRHKNKRTVQKIILHRRNIQKSVFQKTEYTICMFCNLLFYYGFKH